MQNPKLANVVNQANIAGGHQLVNNNTSCEKEIKNEPNELLEIGRYERMDIRAPAEACKSDSEVEAVGEIDGTEKRGREK